LSAGKHVKVHRRGGHFRDCHNYWQCLLCSGYTAWAGERMPAGKIAKPFTGEERCRFPPIMIA
jgi:hypothetical protein